MTEHTDENDEREVVLEFTQGEEKLVRHVLRTADESETDIEGLAEVIQKKTGKLVVFHGGSEEFHEDPPTPSDLLDRMEGQRMRRVDRPTLEALQTCLTFYTIAVTSDPDANVDYVTIMGTVNELHETISDAYELLRDDYSADDSAAFREAAREMHGKLKELDE